MVISLDASDVLDLFEGTWEDLWGEQAISEPVGSVFTKPAIVSLILDLAGYRADHDVRLARRSVLEPGCGDGAFIAEVVRRLLESEQRQVTFDWQEPLLEGALCAVDINKIALDSARGLMRNLLEAAGCPEQRAVELAFCWTVHADFLLHRWERQFDLIVGNPPYVRLEDMPPRVMARYRALYHTLTDRADLYVAFFERGLELLSSDGTLAFICANRFAKNKYGGELRKLISHGFRVHYWLNLEHTQPFVEDVSAYPAIILLDRKQGQSTLAATLDDLSPGSLARLQESSSSGELSPPLAEFARWYQAGEPWITTSTSELTLLERFARTLPTLEGSAQDVKVGIGVATGADDVFVLPGLSPQIEEDLQLPLVLPSDVKPSGVVWSGRYVINPFSADGSLVRLSEFPGLAAYLEEHAHLLRRRHVARSQPSNWYRTIDRIWPALVGRPKLLAPDIQSGGIICFDEGRYYPHHNLYWITSEMWDLRALQAILQSSLVTLQVRAHAVQMRGGNLRYQAQALRRVRVPPLSDLPASLLGDLVKVSGSDQQAVIDAVVERAFTHCGAL